MAGNVWEWVADRYVDPYPPGDSEIPENPTGPEESLDGVEPLRVLRGGAWSTEVASQVRASFRNFGSESLRRGDYGFRCERARRF
jgi:formylglycine-generating enzyme required for sulfatase activity